MAFCGSDDEEVRKLKSQLHRQEAHLAKLAADVHARDELLLAAEETVRSYQLQVNTETAGRTDAERARDRLRDQLNATKLQIDNLELLSKSSNAKRDEGRREQRTEDLNRSREEAELRRQNDELHATVARMEKKLETLTTELRAADSRVLSLEAAAARTVRPSASSTSSRRPRASSVTDLTRAATTNSEVMDLRADLLQSRAECEAAVARAEKSSTALLKLENANLAAERALRTAQEEARHAKVEAQEDQRELRSQVKYAEEQAQAAIKELDAAKEQLSKKEMELTAARTAAASESASGNLSLVPLKSTADHAELLELQKRIKTLEQDLSQTQASNGLHQSSATASSSSDNSSSKEAAWDDLIEEMETLRAEKRKLKMELAILGDSMGHGMVTARSTLVAVQDSSIASLPAAVSWEAQESLKKANLELDAGCSELEHLLERLHSSNIDPSELVTNAARSFRKTHGYVPELLERIDDLQIRVKEKQQSMNFQHDELKVALSRITELEAAASEPVREASLPVESPDLTAQSTACKVDRSSILSCNGCSGAHEQRIQAEESLIKVQGLLSLATALRAKQDRLHAIERSTLSVEIETTRKQLRDRDCESLQTTHDTLTTLHTDWHSLTRSLMDVACRSTTHANATMNGGDEPSHIATSHTSPAAASDESAAIQQLQAQIQELSEKLLRRTEQIGRHQQDLVRRDQKLVDVQMELDKLRFQLQLTAPMVNDTEDQTVNTEAGMTEDDASVETLQSPQTSDCDQTEQDLPADSSIVAVAVSRDDVQSSSAHRYHETQLENERLKQLHSALQGDYSAAIAEQEDAVGLQSEVDALRKEAAELRRQLDIALSERETITNVAFVERQIHAKEAESSKVDVEHLQQQMDLAGNKIKQLETQLSLSSTQMKELSTLQGSLDSLRTSTAHVESQLIGARQELKLATETETQLRKDLSDAEARLQAVNLDAAKHQSDALDVITRAAAVKAELDSVSQVAARQREEMRDLQTELAAALQMTETKIDQNRGTEIASLREQLEACTVELEQLRQSEAFASNSNITLTRCLEAETAKVVSSVARAEELEATQSTMKVEMQALRYDLSASHHNGSQIASKIEELKADLSAQERKVSQLEEEISEQARSCDVHSRKLEEVDNKYWTTKEELGQAQELWEEEESKRLGLEETLASLSSKRESEKDVLEKMIRERTDERDRWEKISRDSNAKIAQLTARLSEETRQIEALNAQLIVSQSSCSQLKVQLQNLTAQIGGQLSHTQIVSTSSDKDGELSEAREMVERLEEQLTEVTEQNSEHEEKILELLTEKKLLTRKLEMLKQATKSAAVSPREVTPIPMVTGSALISRQPHPSKEEVRTGAALSSNVQIHTSISPPSSASSSRKRRVPDDSALSTGSVIVPAQLAVVAPRIIYQNSPARSSFTPKRRSHKSSIDVAATGAPADPSPVAHLERPTGLLGRMREHSQTGRQALSNSNAPSSPEKKSLILPNKASPTLTATSGLEKPTAIAHSVNTLDGLRARLNGKNSVLR